MVMRFPAKENAGSQKHCAISRQEKMPFSTPVGLPWDPLPHSQKFLASISYQIPSPMRLQAPLLHMVLSGMGEVLGLRGSSAITLKI